MGVVIVVVNQGFDNGRILGFESRGSVGLVTDDRTRLVFEDGRASVCNGGRGHVFLIVESFFIFVFLEDS